MYPRGESLGEHVTGVTSQHGEAFARQKKVAIRTAPGCKAKKFDRVLECLFLTRTLGLG